MREQRPGITPCDVWLVEGERVQSFPDDLASEEPLEIRLRVDGAVHRAAVTMRTPGGDDELAAGFLYGEGIVRRRGDVRRSFRPPGTSGVVEIELRDGLAGDLPRLERNFRVTSACGLCGKVSREAIGLPRTPRIPPGPRLRAATVLSLPERLRAAQGVFRRTGGLHAAGLFRADGELLALREDVGRHNALDKLVGWAFLAGHLPLHERLVLVSGRASYELVQKCALAEAPVLAAVSAPSSAAVALAREVGMTLVGFLRGERFNVYAGRERLAVP